MELQTKQSAIEKAKVLKSLIELNKVSKILDSFIPVFKDNTILKSDGTVYLHGSFNLNGTVSGRMSCNRPNLQQIPSSGSIYAKPIKNCFKVADGWLLCSADFSSLEDKISALTTKDKNKLKVYMGHTVYKLNINNTCLHIRDDDIISYGGKLYTGEEFYEQYNTSS